MTLRPAVPIVLTLALLAVTTSVAGAQKSAAPCCRCRTRACRRLPRASRHSYCCQRCRPSHGGAGTGQPGPRVRATGATEALAAYQRLARVCGPGRTCSFARPVGGAGRCRRTAGASAGVLSIALPELPAFRPRDNPSSMLRPMASRSWCVCLQAGRLAPRSLPGVANNGERSPTLVPGRQTTRLSQGRRTVGTSPMGVHGSTRHNLREADPGRGGPVRILTRRWNSARHRRPAGCSDARHPRRSRSSTGSRSPPSTSTGACQVFPLPAPVPRPVHRVFARRTLALPAPARPGIRAVGGRRRVDHAR
jgi:hypothetical protein